MPDNNLIYRRGEAAAKILGDEIVMSAFGDIEAELVTAWANTNPTDTVGREAIWGQIKSMERFQAKLETWKANMLLDKEKSQQRLRDTKGLPIET